MRASINTLRHWNRVNKVASEQARAVDRGVLRSRLRAQCSDFDEVTRALRRVGVITVPHYWSAEKCSKARVEIDRLISAYPDAVREFSGGADKRMFGVEMASPLLAEFHNDPFLKGMGELLGGSELYNFVTLGARIDAIGSNNGSGDGWHRDAHGFQFKSILYLSDTDEKNGPFEYLRGSHKAWRALVDTAVGRLPQAPASRYEDEHIARIAKHGAEASSYKGAAGTLILAYTCGIHRGRPLVSGSRYALTNYYYHPFEIDEGRIEQFQPLIPGTAERVRKDLGLGAAPPRV